MCFDSEQTAAQADHSLFLYRWYYFTCSTFNTSKLVAKRIKREKRIKRGSDAFQGHSLTIYLSSGTESIIFDLYLR